ncbi:MAG TPA: TIGR03621 family F420-dependent LLM class oxidoreductase, partial [Chloroflexia bacterium]
PFRFGVVSSGVGRARDGWIDLARRAEALGYAALLMPDRPSLGGPAPIAALATAAGATTTLRVGSYVFANDYRHPVIVAREAATLDVLSGGRFDLGLGAGVGHGEYEQLGLPFDPPGVRVSRLEEALRLIKQLFTEDRVSFSGRYYAVRDLPGLPKPVQQPHPPIFIGSSGKRMLTFAAREAQMIAPTLKYTPQGPDPADVSLDEKVGWIRVAAGDRFAAIELCQTRYDIAVSDSPAPLAQQAGGPPIPKRPLTIDQAVAALEDERARYGFSYIQISDTQLENFAPVVARLGGK